MSANLYLFYDHVETVEGKTHYYFRAGLFHGTPLENWILLSSNLDFIELLSLPSAVPDSLAAGTIVRAPGGTSYEIPEDIYLCQVQFSVTASPISNPLSDYLEGGIAGQPIVVYSPVSPYTFPPGYTPAEKEPNYGSQWYVPDLDLVTRTVASKKTSYPFWTRVDFSLWGAYGSHEEVCEGLPYNIHCTCFPGQYTQWINPASFRGIGYWLEPDYFRNVTSQETVYMGQTITYTSGTIYTCDVHVWSPSSIDDPVIWFAGAPTPLPVSMAPYVGFLALAADVLPDVGEIFSFFPKISFAFRQEVYMVVNSSDKALVNINDFAKVIRE